MIDGWDIYWITRLDAFNFVWGGVIFVCGVVIFLTAIKWDTAFYERDVDDYMAPREIQVERKRKWKEDLDRTMGRRIRRAVIVAVVAVAGAVFVPSTKEAIAIKVVPMVANSEDVQGLGADVVKVAREWLEEARPKKQDAALVPDKR